MNRVYGSHYFLNEVNVKIEHLSNLHCSLKGIHNSLLKSETEDTKRSTNEITLAARFCNLSILFKKYLSHFDQITLLKVTHHRSNNNIVVLQALT